MLTVAVRDCTPAVSIIISTMEHCLALVVLLMSAARPVHPFSSGAPQAACTTLSPNATQHGASPQATDIPYVLNLSALYDLVIDQLVYTPNTVYDSK